MIVYGTGFFKAFSSELEKCPVRVYFSYPVMDGEKVLSFVFSNGLAFSIPVALSLCVKAGLFKKLSHGRWVSVKELSQEGSWDLQGLMRVLELLKMMGLLEFEGEKVRLNPEILEYFRDDSPFSVLGMLESVTKFFIPRWMGLFDRMEGKGLSSPSVTPDFYVGLSRALFSLNRGEAERLRDVIGFLPSKVLDVGAGSCVWSVPFAASGSHVWAIDYDKVLDGVSRPILEKLGLLERYTFLRGDMWDIPWEGPYDLVIMANIIHGLKDPEKERLISMAKRSLGKGGVLAIVEFLRDGVSISPYIFNIHMYVMSGGGVISVDEAVELLEGSGFSQVRVEVLNKGKGSYAVLGVVS